MPLTKKNYLPLIFLAVFIISFLYIFETNRDKLSDTVVFRGDDFSYQSIGVNLVMGHGYRIGGIEEFATYKFSGIGKNYGIKSSYDNFSKDRRYGFLIAPAYPFFIAFIYKLFGIHPYALRIAHMILLALSASFLPIIGNYYWRNPGIIAGLVTSFFFMIYFLPDPMYVAAESLTIFGLFVLTICLMLWEANPSFNRIFFLGVACGANLLIKMVSLFVPLFLLLYIILELYKTKIRFKSPCVFILAFALCVLPWGIYRGQYKHLLQQAKALVLDGNNEDSLKTGERERHWYRENKGDPRYIYNRLGKSSYSSAQKLFIFLNQNKKDIPMMVKNRMYKAFFYHNVYTVAIIGMFLYYLIIAIPQLNKINRYEKLPIFPLVYFLNIFFINLITFGSKRHSPVFLPFIMLPAAYLLINILKSLIPKKQNR